MRQKIPLDLADLLVASAFRWETLYTLVEILSPTF